MLPNFSCIATRRQGLIKLEAILMFQLLVCGRGFLFQGGNAATPSLPSLASGHLSQQPYTKICHLEPQNKQWQLRTLSCVCLFPRECVLQGSLKSGWKMSSNCTPNFPIFTKNKKFLKSKALSSSYLPQN